MIISKILLPIFVFVIVIYGLYKKIDIYEVFISGVKEGLTMSINIFPTIFAMSLAINILIKSNVLNVFIDFISHGIKYFFTHDIGFHSCCII